MRLNRLDLIRYGRFQDRSLHFPRPTDGTPDVTLVFGPNEAGKSTAFEGFLELLFGLKRGEHPYAFAFGRADLLVGAELDLPGRGPTVLRRNGKQTNSLMDAELRPVEERLLTAHLHGLTREAYETRFSLNDETLRKGGAAIAKADGDLGQLLHAGVSGLSGMAAALEDMAARADAFYRKGRHGTQLKAGKDRLAEIGRELRALRLTPDRDRALRQARDDAKAAFDAADAALHTARQRQAAGSAAASWQRVSAEIAVLERELEECPDGPDLPTDAPERVAGLAAVITERTERIAEAERKAAEHRRVIADRPPDDTAAALATELAQLDRMSFDGAPLLSRAETAGSDLETRRRERDACRADLDAATRRIAPEGTRAEGLLLDTAAIEEIGVAAQDCIDARAARSAAEERRDEARDALGEEPARPRDLSGLEAALDACSTVADLSVEEAALRQAAAQAATSAAGLPGAWRACVAEGLPAAETLVACAEEMTTCDSRISDAEEALATLDAAHRAACAERRVSEAAPTAIDAERIEATRGARDAAWHAHRAVLDAESASRFEEAMRADDGARANFMAGADDRHRVAAARSAEASAEAALDAARRKLAGITARREEVRGAAARLAEALGLPRDTVPSAFPARRTALLRAEADRAALETAERERAAAAHRREAALADLRTAAAAAGLDAGDAELTAQARTQLIRRDDVRRAWDAWTARKAALADREADVAAKTLLLDEALARLDRQVRSLPLADRAPEAVRAALPTLRDIGGLHRRRTELDGRVDAMARAIAALRAVAGRLAGLLGSGVSESDDAMAVVTTARLRVAAAEAATQARTTAEAGAKSEMHARDTATRAVKAARDEIAALFDGQGGADLPPSERAALLKGRDDRRKRIRELEAQRREARAGVSEQLFEDELARLPDPTRAAALATATEDAERDRDAARDHWREAERHQEEAHAAADPAQLIAEQAVLRETLRQGARQAAIRRIGERVAREALRRLARERRSTMLDDVRDAFVAMTAPAWRNVEAWTHDQGEKLVGTTADGTLVHVERMSSGTMGQLYFALRLAGYRSFVRESGPLPMVLDDIMETFDNTRAREALKLCGALGREGQAIMFTHHDHLIELARESIPGVAVVEMDR